MVSDLIDQEITAWDEGVVRTVFHPDDAAEILAIPLRRDIEDWVAWHFDSKGIFSVKSAYQLGVSVRDLEQNRDASSSTAVNGQNLLWKTVWNLKLPGKVKKFSWRLCHNSLPTRMNIKRKRVELDTRCPMCNRADEDGGHLFLKCKKVKPVWRNLLLDDVRLSLLGAPNSLVFFEQILALKEPRRSLVLVLLWDWWTARNKMNAEGKEGSADEICHRIQRHCMDLQVAGLKQRFSCGESLVGAQIKEVWCKPPVNHVKVNFDAAFIEEMGQAAWGFIARSDEGEFIAAAAGRLLHAKDAFQAEAEACHAAVEGAAAIGLHRLIFESDCKNLVTELKGLGSDLAAIGVILKEVRSLCIASFESHEFQFVPRSCNSAAQSLAQYGLRADVSCTGWEGVAPDFVSVLVASDIAVHYE